MAVMGTFSSFTTATLAIYASQSSLNVTGNNIANINTKGYTRQRMDLVSLYNAGEARYANAFNLNIGYGVLCQGVNQLRDPFLDIRYRNENANLGAQQAKLEGLMQISHILDEVGRGDEGFGVIEDQLGDFLLKLGSWDDDTGVDNYEKLVMGSANTLAKLFNAAAKDLETVYSNQEKYLEESVTKVNGLLNQIRDLNEQIRAHGIYGDQALELRDARNVAIDELSSLINIDVTYSMEKIDQFTEVEKLTITLPGTEDPALSKTDAEIAAQKYNDAHKNDPDFVPKTWSDFASSNAGKPIKLIDGIYGTQLNIEKKYTKNPEYNGKYLDEEGLPTDNIDEAKMVQDPADPTKLIPEENPDYDPAKDYTKSMWVDKNNPQTPVDKDDPNAVLNPDYQGKYLKASPDKNDIKSTDDPDEADFVYDDKYLMNLDPLVDKRGFYMKDPKYGNKLRGTTYLNDNDLFGAIQSMRELLTEEGEFASKEDLGKGLDRNAAGFDPNSREARIADADAATKRGIPYYMKALDNLAQQFARELNKINQPDQYAKSINTNTNSPVFSDHGGLTYDMIYKTIEEQPPKPWLDKVFMDKDGNPVKKEDGTDLTMKDVMYANLDPLELYTAPVRDADGNLQYNADGTVQMETAPAFASLEDQQQAIRNAQENMELLRDNGVLTQEWDFYKGGVLISNNGNSNDPTNITAANISVSEDWATGAVQVLKTVQPNEIYIKEDGQQVVITHTSGGDNIQHMISSLRGQRDFFAVDIQADSADRGNYFRGSFEEFFTNISGTLGRETNVTTKLYNNFDLTTLKLDNDRQSVSGVDLNEEATSMMQFQKSYSAACQLLTTLDSMLDKLINGTIR